MLRLICCSISLAILFSAGPLLADNATYTFEPPNFAASETTPYLNRAPNDSTGALGSSLRADFVGSSDPAAFQTSFDGTNTFLSAVSDPNAVLTVSLNEPVISLSLPFAIAGPSTGSFLRLITPFGSLDAPASGSGGPGGTPSGFMNFTSATPFTTFQLAGSAGRTQARYLPLITFFWKL